MQWRSTSGAQANGAVTTKLARVEIENYHAIQKLDLPLDSRLTVLHGDNGHGKTSVLSAIAMGLGSIPMGLPAVSSVGFRKSDRRGLRPLRVGLTTRARGSDGAQHFPRLAHRPSGRGFGPRTALVSGMACGRRVAGPQRSNVLRE